jgi:catechol 2,3-dioxygenase-like lactoylglutathione lyase family enzyme
MRHSHIALHVRDLSTAERFYSTTFGMDVITRETLTGDAGWQQLPPHLGWSDAGQRGVTVHMVALRRDDMILALFAGSPSPGVLYLVGLRASPAEIAEVRSRLTDATRVEGDQEDALTFVDPFDIRWQLTASDFRGSGERSGAWIDT